MANVFTELEDFKIYYSKLSKIDSVKQHFFTKDNYIGPGKLPNFREMAPMLLPEFKRHILSHVYSVQPQ